MKKKYITPEFVLVDIDVNSIFAASPNSMESTSEYKTGNYEAESTEYRSTLWN